MAYAREFQSEEARATRLSLDQRRTAAGRELESEEARATMLSLDQRRTAAGCEFESGEARATRLSLVQRRTAAAWRPLVQSNFHFSAAASRYDPLSIIKIQLCR